MINQGGRELFGRYTSLHKALNALYPDFPWQLSRFCEVGRAPRGFLQDTNNLLDALERAERKIGVKKVEPPSPQLFFLLRSPLSLFFFSPPPQNQPEDWYSIRLSDLKDIGFPGRPTRMQLVNLLMIKYPDYTWEKVFLLRGKYAQQQRLERVVTSLFPVSLLFLYILQFCSCYMLWCYFIISYHYFLLI